ncbi:MAG: hypothetical protein LBE85_09465 [Candidatus Accumulibacter sp.]|jgi:hypothetical protein|nr:hypothetical protein [Accumulibacter sp.]
MTDDPQKPVSPALSETSSDDEQPEIYGITQGKDGIVLNRRSFIGALATAGALAACPPALGAGKPAASPKTLGSGKAHEGKLDGLELQDKTLFSWDKDALKAWDIAKGSLIKTVAKARLGGDFAKAGSTFPSLFRRVWDAPVVAFGPNGKTTATSDKDGLKIWLPAKEKSGRGTTARALGLPMLVNALAFHPDGTKLAAGWAADFIAVWNLEDDKMQSLKGARNEMLSLAFHPAKPLLLSGHLDGNVRQWSLSDGKQGKILKCHSKPIRHLAVTPDGKMAVTASDDQTIKLWSLPDGKEMASLNVPLGETTSAMDLGADGQLLASGTPQGRIYLWRMPMGEMLGCLYDPALLEKGTAMAQYRQMGREMRTQACDKALPQGATCVCDCVGDNRMGGTTLQVCTCDTIAVPAGYAGPKGGCVCDTVAVGTRVAPAATTPPQAVPKAPGGCSCVGNVSRGGGHYWRPN